MKLGFDTLAARMAAAIVATLLIAQWANVALIVGEQRLTFALAQRTQAIEQFVRHAEALHAGDPSLPLVASETGRMQFFSVGRSSAAAQLGARGAPAPEFEASLVRRLRQAGLADLADRAAVRSYVVDGAEMHRIVARSGLLGESGEDAPPQVLMREDARFALTIMSAPLPGGRWLNSTQRTPQLGRELGGRVLTGTILLLATAIVVTLWLAWLIARPLRRLAQACEDLRVGREVAPIPENGPRDVRHMIAAFNALNDGRNRLIDLQRRMIGAIGHDLRTPLTTLRLRAEKIDEAENRERMIAVVEEAQQTIDAVLSFVREGVAPEPTRRVDIHALVEALCADYRDLGHDVEFEGGAEHVAVSLRSAQMTRALRNLIENALKYGARARLRILRHGEELEIQVDDDGPGVSEQDLETVFEPFVRLEQSRNRETGGLGLGLAITRTIARSHGGEVTLMNRPEGGARAALRVPVTSSEQR